jgi:hypothetical protein
VKTESYDKPFDLKQVPVSVEPITVTEKKPSALAVEPTVRKEEKSRTSRQDIYARKLFFDLIFYLFRFVQLQFTFFRATFCHCRVLRPGSFIPIFAGC